MTANHPQEAAGARLAGERAESEVRDAEPPNEPQTGTERFVPGWAPHMDAYAKSRHPAPVPVPADEVDVLRTENARLRHELEVMYGGAFDTTPVAPSADVRDQIARAIHRYDYEAGLSGNDIPSKHHRGEADAVLRVPAIAEALAAVAAVERVRAYADRVQTFADLTISRSDSSLYAAIASDIRKHAALEPQEQS